MVAALSVVSCKNNKKTSKDQEIQEQKEVFADSVLAMVDGYAQEFIKADGMNKFRGWNISEEQKLVKPDYLFDPAEVNKLVTMKQKYAALAYMTFDQHVRVAYDMPLSEADQAIKKLAAELNFPTAVKEWSKEAASEFVAEVYNSFKDNGNVQYFWEYQYAFYTESIYVISQNPEVFFNGITEEDYYAAELQFFNIRACIEYLAKYDEEIAKLQDMIQQTAIAPSIKEAQSQLSSIDDIKTVLANSVEYCAARRNALLQ